MTAPRYTAEQLTEFLKETESRLDNGIPTTVRLDKLSSVLRQAAETERALERTWQPIETAPKDGNEILLGASDGLGWVCGGYFSTEINEWRQSVADGDDCAVFPTHWMPLPSPPSPAEARQEQE